MAQVIGRYREDPDFPWRDNQAANVQYVHDNLTFDFSLLDADIYVRFPLNVDGSGWGHYYPGTGTANHMLVAAHLNDQRQRYAIAHETGHFADDSCLKGNQTTFPVPSTRDQVRTYFDPKANKSWKAGDSFSSDKENFAHQFTKLYATSSGLATWGNILDLNALYFRHFATTDYAAIKTIVSTSGGGDGGGDGGDGSGAIEYAALKDLPRRKNKATGAWQACGLHRHLITGFLPITGTPADYIYDFLIQFDINSWPDAAQITAAYMELVLVSSDTDSLMTAPGPNAALKAQLVTGNWSEGNNPSGTWDNTDYQNPTVNSTTVAIGSVGAVTDFFGTVIRFDVLSLVRQWGPTTLSFGALGPGQNKPNRGLLVKAVGLDGPASAAEFGSQQYASPHTNWRPVLRLEYTAAAVNPIAFTDVPVATAESNIFNFEGEYIDPLGTDHLAAAEIEVRKAVAGAYVWQPGG